MKSFERRAQLYALCALLLCLVVAVNHVNGADDGQTSSANDNVSDSGHQRSDNTSHHNTTDEEHEHIAIHVARLDFASVREPFVIALVVLVTAVVKLIFHSSEKISSYIPESCLLISFGFVVGGLIKLSPNIEEHFKFTPTVFFHYLLPPIVLEAGYLMHKRYFFGNLGSILMYAVIGTLWNTFAVALCLYGVSAAGGVSVSGGLSFVECMLMGTIIAAVDPVAVLAIFDEVHVNLLLYILVFGESLLNDAVSVVLYRTAETFVKFEKYNLPITGDQIVLAIVSFFTISLGGTAIGVVWGMAASFITRFTDHVRVIETLMVIICGYLAYLTAEIFHFSGIMSAIACGVVMRHYLNPNVSGKSRTTIKYTLKMLSSASETVVFMFLGFASISSKFEWDTGLVLGTLVFALIFRFLGVFGLTWILNRKRIESISLVDQFIMGYGGLRGAVSFSLVLLLEDEVTPAKNAIFTALFTLIMFTVFVQGTTVKPLVQRLHVKTYHPKKESINVQLHNKMMDHVAAGIEEIIGQHGDHWLVEVFMYYDNRYIKPLLSRSDKEIAETLLNRLEKHFHCETTHRHLDQARRIRRRSTDDALLDPRHERGVPSIPTLPSALSALNLNRDNMHQSMRSMLAPTKYHPIHAHTRNQVSDDLDMVRLRLLRLRRMQDADDYNMCRPRAVAARSASERNVSNVPDSPVAKRRSEFTRRRCASECAPADQADYDNGDEMDESLYNSPPSNTVHVVSPSSEIASGVNMQMSTASYTSSPDQIDTRTQRVVRFSPDLVSLETSI